MQIFTQSQAIKRKQIVFTIKNALNIFSAEFKEIPSSLQILQINKEGKIAAVFSSETDHISPADHVTKSLEVVKGI